LINNPAHIIYEVSLCAKLAIQCLGEFKVDIDGTQVSAFDTDKARALLVYLAVESRRTFRRSFLAGLFWPDDEEERALHNLRQTLSMLRKTLGDSNNDPPYILSDRETIQLNPFSIISVDYLEFVALMNKALQPYQNHTDYNLFHVRYLKEAANLFQGEFLTQFSVPKSILFEEWVILRREEINIHAIRVLSLLSIYHEKRAEYTIAISYLSKIVSICPWDESARNRMIYLLGVDKQWSAAKSQFFALKRYLQEVLAVEPSRETQELFNEINQASLENKSIELVYPNDRSVMPQTMNTFVGRKNELDRIVDLLITPTNRLITIFGLGGIGKTRFALEVGHLFRGLFADGVYFVSLLSVKSYDQLILQIGQAMSVPFSDKTDNRNQLIDYLFDKQILLILDNFEHLLADKNCVSLIDIFLNRLEKVKILVTSRELLNLVQEQVFSLKGLQYPDGSVEIMNDAKSYDAVQLFLHRVEQKMPDMQKSPALLEQIARICTMLEGMPLGVELAAAMTYEQGREQLSTLIEENLFTLATRMSNVQTKHRSLSAAFEISWDLLTPQFKQILCDLSIFIDGFSLRAAQFVANASAQNLTALVGKSLLRHDFDDRYSFHEAIRQFVRNIKCSNIEIDEVQSRHANFYQDFLGELHTAIMHEQQVEALDQIQKEYGNIAMAWKWACDHQKIDFIKNSIDSLYYYFSIRSYFIEGIKWFDQAINQFESVEGSELILGMLYWRIGAMAYTIRDENNLLCNLKLAERILDRIDAQYELAYCRFHLGWYYQREKKFAKSLRYSRLAAAYFEQQNDITGLSQTYLLEGSIENRQGNYEKSHPYFEKSYLYCKQSNNPRNLLVSINRLADISCYEGNYDEAIDLYIEALKISENLNDRYNQAIMYNNLGTIHHVQNNFEVAEKYYSQSLEITRELGDLDGVALALNNLGELATWQEQFEKAKNYSKEALEIARKIEENWTIIVCLNSLGEIYCGMGEIEKSKAYFVEGLSLARDVLSWDLFGRILINLGRLHQLTGDIDKAVQCLEAGLSHSATEQDSREKAIKWLNMMGKNIANHSDDSLMQKVIDELDMFTK
jgi:predicted ATPase/DNA-binding SARP family transcriptional activator/Tfp pilus assembly protein PilF